MSVPLLSPLPPFDARLFPPPAPGACALPFLGVIRAEGEDAAAFLQGQLTQDVLHQPVGTARLAAFCTPKGRMTASFTVLKPGAHELLLVCSRDLLPATLKRLSMFVLRAKARLSDASGHFRVWGLIGEDAIEKVAAMPQPMGAEAQKDSQAPTAAPLPAPLAAPLIAPLPPAAGQPRALWLAPADTGTDRAAPALPSLPALAEADWLRAEVQAGVARLTAPVADAFVPQMLNYESAGGVHFKKGCYPGQEVVARSQFRGAIKRRAFVACASGPAAAGQDVFMAGDEQPVGLIAQAAPAPGSEATWVIAALPLAAVDGGAPLHAGQPGGPLLHGLHIPYALAEDI
ncbi:folate-binding protein [Comamonadaceae bacterium OH2545_COT-014]|nr:folate-binding protein [Comamonadaceae bacterium OH2545_COT-014]